jgi:hypothetical protein
MEPEGRRTGVVDGGEGAAATAGWSMMTSLSRKTRR